MFDKILSGTYVMSSHHKSPAIAQIIKLLLTNDPATRITVDVLVEEFSKIPIEIWTISFQIIFCKYLCKIATTSIVFNFHFIIKPGFETQNLITFVANLFSLSGSFSESKLVHSDVITLI